MTIVIDASALVALATDEIEAHRFADEIDRHSTRLCCAIGLWEAARAVARKRGISVVQAGEALDALLADLSVQVASIDATDARRAMEVHDRYGKGRHSARLNMGDCFAYACAKTNRARLLYKGDDFVHTDLA